MLEDDGTDVTEERMDVGFAVWKVPDGTTVEEVHEEGIFEVAEGESETFVSSAVTEEGTERVMSTTLDVAGTWLVNCFVFGTGDLDGGLPGYDVRGRRAILIASGSQRTDFPAPVRAVGDNE